MPARKSRAELAADAKKKADAAKARKAAAKAQGTVPAAKAPAASRLTTPSRSKVVHMPGPLDVKMELAEAPDPVHVSKAPGKPGRPEFKLDGKALESIESLSGIGLTISQIAAVLGCSERTLFRHKGSEEAVSSAFERGKAKAQGLVGKALFKKAQAGDVAAIKWWEMTRAGRSEKVENNLRVTHEDALGELE